MNITIKHSLPGRLRLLYNKREINSRQAILAQTLIAVQEGILDITVNTMIGSYLVLFDESLISIAKIQALYTALTDKYLEDQALLDSVAAIPESKNFSSLVLSMGSNWLARRLLRFFLPPWFRYFFLTMAILPRATRALESIAQGKTFTTDLLDTTALTVAAATGNFSTVSSISFLLKLGEKIEEFTKHRSYGNLAQTLLLSNENAHLLTDGEEQIVPASTLRPGDTVIVRSGTLIPADGTVIDGEGAVNQASITGEAIPVEKHSGQQVFAGTILEEGELTVEVQAVGSNTKVQNIISLIDRSQNLKSRYQSQSEVLAERIVPFNFLLAGLTYLFTRNVAKTVSTLMVDYSCAMKLAAPISVLATMREATTYGISVKGGIYLEGVAEADTIIFDKTGTLTNAEPVVRAIHPLQGYSEEEVLRLAACLEEHFPHPLGRAVVTHAEQQQLLHPETHAKVEYIVAHGIASTLDDKKIRIGSAHFIFGDEKVSQTKDVKTLLKSLENSGDSLLYLAVDGKLVGVLAIGDPVRPDAPSAIEHLRQLGVQQCVMITGDTEGAAATVAQVAGLDDWQASALPEDKVNFVESQKQLGHRVMMVGDGINDAPALSAAHVGVAVDGCSAIAGDIADITISQGGLQNIVLLRLLSGRLMERMKKNNALIIGANSLLLVGGIFGFIPPTLAAVLHNSLTVGICLHSMQPLLPPTTV